MQRNIVCITVCTDLIEDSFMLPSFFNTFETSCVLALSYSRSCMPFVFSSSLFFLVRGRSISNAALNFSSSFPCSAFPFFMPAFFAGMIGATAMFAWGVFSFLGLPMIQADQQWQHLGHPFLLEFVFQRMVISTHEKEYKTPTITIFCSF